MPINEVIEAFDKHIKNIPLWFIDLDATPFRLLKRDEVKQKCVAIIHSITETDIEQHTSYANQRREDVIRTLVKGAVKYAALSHTWREEIEEEFTYQQMVSPDSVRDGPGWEKLKQFVKLAKSTFKCQFAWLDTVCVDRHSPDDQQAAARYGFDWFRNAHVCIVYLASTRFLAELKHDRWFRRGWPLTELLASIRMKFYGAGWEPLNFQCPGAENDKADSSFLDVLSQASGISVDDLRFFLPDPKIEHTA
ncbi:hypothetical protein EV363DRAFT_274384 [Boletus edulis]|nr:hypothetical protein EV363DRAFT_274384 [Boletus edulis]